MLYLYPTGVFKLNLVYFFLGWRAGVGWISEFYSSK